MNLFLYRFRPIRVYALVGSSGSGKSFRAQTLIDKYNIDILIDDGLIIQDSKIISGKTAKGADSILGAVATAIFEGKKHRTDARIALQQSAVRRVLVLGTSQKMVRRICDALLLSHPHKIVNIEDIASEKEIQTARIHRDTQGSHVVPVPAFEMEQSFPDMLVSSIRVLFRKSYGFVRKNYAYQKSIVRPLYNRKGVIKLSEQALLQLVSNLTSEYEQRIIIKRVRCYPQDSEYNIEVHIAVPAKGLNLTKILPRFHDYLIPKIQSFSGIIVRKLDIIIDNIHDEHP